MTDPRHRLLQLTLTVNAVSSALCGALLFLAAVPLSPVFGLPSPAPLAVFGALLFGFALVVFRARREPLDAGLARIVFVLDVAYVIASALFLLGWPQALSPMGRLFTALVADLVAVFAVLEYVGLRRARTPAAA
jgi:hypothetical protein